MIGHKRIKVKDENLDSKKKDADKINYLFFQRCFWIEDIERFFKGKYTYNEIRDIIREKRKEYYEKENVNGR